MADLHDTGNCVMMPMTDGLKSKILMMAAEIISMHGSVAGNRCCQDWSGEKELMPSSTFTKGQQIRIMHDYELDNSNLEDFDPEYLPVDDEMVISFALSYQLKLMATELSK